MATLKVGDRPHQLMAVSILTLNNKGLSFTDYERTVNLKIDVDLCITQNEWWDHIEITISFNFLFMSLCKLHVFCTSITYSWDPEQGQLA